MYVRLGVIGSLRGLVTSNVVGLETLTDLRIDEVVVFAEPGCDKTVVKELVSEACRAAWALVRVIELEEDPREWLEAVSRHDIDVVDITPGRKIHALSLLLGALEVGARARYCYLVNEARYGYRYFGYAPPSNVKILEIGRSMIVSEVLMRIPDFLSEGEFSPVRVAPEVLHSFLNIARIDHTNLVIEGCCTRIELVDNGDVVLVNDFSQSFSNPRACEACGYDDALWCLESVAPPPNLDEVVAKIGRCVSNECILALDTNVAMRMLVDRLEDEVPRVRKYLHVPEAVARELLTYLEQKRGSEGVKKLLGFVELAKRGLVLAPPTGPRGDQAILSELRRLRNERRCVCVATADQRLCLAAKSVANEAICVEIPRNPRILDNTSMKNLLTCLALHGETIVKSGEQELLRVRPLKPHEIDPRNLELEAVSQTYPKLLQWLKSFVTKQLKYVGQR